MNETNDHRPLRKLHAPATLRNRDPIVEVLARILPGHGDVLEVGCGSGEHAAYFAAAFPALRWRPTDIDPDCLESARAHAAEAGCSNVLPPLVLDATRLPWPESMTSAFAAVVSINMIHIAPWPACTGLMAGAAGALRPGGVLVLYGPFTIDGDHTAPSNAAFDRQLRAMAPDFGVRDLGAVAAEAAVHGLTLEHRVAMPANNLTVVFRRNGPVADAIGEHPWGGA